MKLRKSFVGLMAFAVCGMMLGGCQSKDTAKETQQTKKEDTYTERKVSVDYSKPAEEILLSYTEKGMNEFKRNFPDKLAMDFALTSIGKDAPDFEYKNIKGETVKLSELKGKKVVLDFMRNDCPVCKESLPTVTKMKETYKDVVFLPIFPKDSKEEIEKFFKDLNLEVNENSVAGKDNGENLSIVKNYNLKLVPSFIFIDEFGKISYTWIGSTDEKIFKDTMDTAFGKKKLYDFVKTEKIDKNGKVVEGKTEQKKEEPNKESKEKK
ncbi:TlpA family protein disulfide reductase [Bacillus sp. NPDC094106]|uniref:TlpA family protein disulfide reductase n=1 Tax=Bacillus sp. NPDC094106 TaxID=3363949 RepID=UPI00382B6BDB